MSAPILSWDAIFNITKVELKLASDVDMYFFQKRYERGRFLNF